MTMSNIKYNNIEYYKAELIKKDEIIEKLFDEVDNIKDIKSGEEFKNQLEELKIQYQELNKINHNLKIENENLKVEIEKLTKNEVTKTIPPASYMHLIEIPPPLPERH